MQYMRTKELAKMLSISRTTIWRWTKSGYLPQPMHLGPKTILWSHDEIKEWLKQTESIER